MNDQTAVKTLDQMVVELARARREQAAHKAICDTVIEEARQRPEYQQAADAANRYALMVLELTNQIKDQAAADYDGNKNPCPGVKIQEKTVAVCTDEDAARKYAVDRPMLIQVDWKALAQIAVKVHGTALELPFYEVKKEPTATIAQDLDKILIDSDMPF